MVNATRSDGVVVSEYFYNAAGFLESSVDHSNESVTTYDGAGRQSGTSSTFYDYYDENDVYVNGNESEGLKEGMTADMLGKEIPGSQTQGYTSYSYNSFGRMTGTSTSAQLKFTMMTELQNWTPTANKFMKQKRQILLPTATMAAA